MTKQSQTNMRGRKLPGPPSLANSVENWLPLSGGDVGSLVLIHAFAGPAFVTTNVKGFTDAEVKFRVLAFSVGVVENIGLWDGSIAVAHVLCEA